MHAKICQRRATTLTLQVRRSLEHQSCCQHSDAIRHVVEVLSNAKPCYAVLCLGMMHCCLQVLCNAAKSDKARIQQLEVELARLSHRSEAAEAANGQLQAQLKQLQVRTSTADSITQGLWLVVAAAVVLAIAVALQCCA